jgi:hypothetical protein
VGMHASPAQDDGAGRSDNDDDELEMALWQILRHEGLLEPDAGDPPPAEPPAILHPPPVDVPPPLEPVDLEGADEVLVDNGADNDDRAGVPDIPVPPVPRERRVGVRGARTVDKYPRLWQRPPAECPDGAFHGIRCVRNPHLHAGQWDSMKAICAVHPACGVSRSLNDNRRRPAQGRCLGFLWSWLQVADEYDDKDAHQEAALLSAPPEHNAFRWMGARQAARLAAYAVIAALPADDIEFWSRAERPRRAGEPDGPPDCA